MITFVITFRNEGEEVLTTVRGLRDTCGEEVTIHLIDDGSDDGYDYEKVADKYHCIFERFAPSRGPAVNRNYGADVAKTEYVMFLDAHMRFYEENWHHKVIAAIKSDPNAIYCTLSKPLRADEEEFAAPIGHGATVNFTPGNPAGYLHPAWNTQPLSHVDTPQIPVVLGATYAFTQEFFRRIGGYLGLKGYGGEEVYLSAKAWMFGGSCRLINNVTIGHLYRTSEEVPWRDSESRYFYNRLVTGAVLLPQRQLAHLFDIFNTASNLERTRKQLEEDEGFLKNLRDYIQSEAVHDISHFYEMNRRFRNCHNLEQFTEGDVYSEGDQKKLISLILPTYNNADLTIKCLESIKAHTRNDVFIIWIDNGSSNEQVDLVKKALVDFDYVMERHPTPLGFAKAVNRGLEHVIGEYCAILNNDIEVNQDWDVDLIRAVDEYPGLAGPMAVNSIGWQSTHLHNWLGIPGLLQNNRKHIANWLRMHWGGKIVDIPQTPNLPYFRNMLAFFCVLMPTSVIKTLGLLDENFGWGYCEDDDYCQRARTHQLAISLCPGSSVMHWGGRTMQLIQDDHHSRLQRNTEYLADKWGAVNG